MDPSYEENSMNAGKGILYNSKLSTRTEKLVRELLVDQTSFETQPEELLHDKIEKLASLYDICRDMTLFHSVEELCKRIVEHIVSAMHHSNVSVPLIEIDDRKFTTDQYNENLSNFISVQIIAHKKKYGQLFVFYKDNSLRFSPIEKSFLNIIANDLGIWLEQKQQSDAREALLEESKRIERSLDSHAIIAVTDKFGIITRVNKKFCEVSQYSIEELLGQDHRIINSRHHPKDFIHNLWDTIQEGNIWQENIKNRAKDGSYYWVDTTIVPFIDEAGKPYQYVAITNEITKYKLLEQKMASQVAKLKNSNDELKQIAYVITHDSQEPLRVIVGFIKLLEEYCNERLDEHANELIMHAVAGTKRMQIFINDLFDYAKVDADQSLVTVDSNILVENILTDYAVIIKENNAIITYDALPIITGVHLYLTQLFTNLIRNALKFQREQPPKIHISARLKASAWTFSVADNGIGIEAQYTGRIFKVCQRLHTPKEYPGTGIGLAICKKVVEYHSGQIWVESIPNQGSTFYFTIPENSLKGIVQPRNIE